MPVMETHTIEVLELENVRRIVANYASCGLGREVALKMAPLKDRDKIDKSLKQAEELAELLSEEKRLPLSGLHDLKKLIRQAVELHRPFEPSELLDIESTLKTAKSLSTFFYKLPAKYHGLKGLSRRFKPFDKIIDLIERMIDRRGKVADNASEKLEKVRAKMHKLKFALRDKIEGIIQSRQIRKHLQNSDVTIRNGRFVLPVKVHSKNFVEGILHGKSTSGETVYIEPEQIVLDGNEYQDLLFEENREVTTVLWRCTRSVLGRKRDILELRDILAWVDFTYAKARFALEYRCSAPAISADDGLELKEARHPLLISLALKNKEKDEDVFEKVVPSDVRIGEDFRMLVITGPNTGGKTVALKTLGLLTLMALSGCPVPASPESRVPVFSKVLADIGDEQSIEQSLSTFSSHVGNIKRILDQADDKTLVLLDELGSGTDPQEGGALARAVLEKLLEKKTLTVATTHLGELKEFAYTHSGVQNASLEFDRETFKPTFRMFIGQPGNSNALKIAANLGLSEKVLARAGELLGGEDTETSQVISKMQDLRSEAEKNRNETSRVLEEAREKEKQLEAEREKTAKKEKVLSEEADRRVDAILKSTRDKIMHLLKDLKSAPAPHGEKALSLEKLLESELADSPLESRRREFAQSLKKGQEVYIISFARQGRIKTINKTKEKIVVQMGPMEVETDFTNVSWIDGRGVS